MNRAGWEYLASVLGQDIGGREVFTNEFIPADAPKW
jgi:hypothetical protein